jgi:hypothetical protein
MPPAHFVFGSIARLSVALLLSTTLRSPAAPNPTPAAAKIAIPYVPTRHDTVRDLLWLADVGTNDIVYDLGSGDGRVVIAAVRDFGVRRAVGIELDPKLVQVSRKNAAEAGVDDRVLSLCLWERGKHCRPFIFHASPQGTRSDSGPPRLAAEARRAVRSRSFQSNRISRVRTIHG